MSRSLDEPEAALPPIPPTSRRSPSPSSVRARTRRIPLRPRRAATSSLRTWTRRPRSTTSSPRKKASQGDDDVLETTPEFLQDAPEHDRLWFEQRPPRDFDFDG